MGILPQQNDTWNGPDIVLHIEGLGATCGSTRFVTISFILSLCRCHCHASVKRSLTDFFVKISRKWKIPCDHAPPLNFNRQMPRNQFWACVHQSKWPVCQTFKYPHQSVLHKFHILLPHRGASNKAINKPSSCIMRWLCPKASRNPWNHCTVMYDTLTHKP